jgi:DNA-binding NarL/FixJ family response regulator
MSSPSRTIVTHADVTRADVIRTDAGAATRLVLIVDDHPLYRAGLKSVLGRLPLRFAEAGTLMAAIDVLEQDDFDLVLYDWHLPDQGGCKGLNALRALVPTVPVVVISADDDEAIEVAAHHLGAVARLTKAKDGDAIRAVVCGILNCTDADSVVVGGAAVTQAAAAAPVGLTHRQRDVLRQLASGASNKHIARALGIADSTVRAHVSDILDLLHARNRTEAVVRAYQASLLMPGR